MKNSISFLLITLIFFSCKNKNEKSRTEVFNNELTKLIDYFHIPGVSAKILKGEETIYENYIGMANIKNKVKMDEDTAIPIASLTKIYASVLIMKLVEEEKLLLDDPISKYFEDKNYPDSILVRHILSHTSQGNLGENFYYSSRFGLLTRIIEKAGDAAFEDQLQQKIFKPLEMDHTFLLHDEAFLKSKGMKYALPYFFEGEIKEGAIEYGFSTAAGIISTINDLAKFNIALDQNNLIKESSKLKMFTPQKSSLPYGFGIFSQSYLGKKLIWGYGQYDCYSSLFLKVPEDNITLILAANNNLMSDPARLIYGDVTYSMFALSFLKNYVFNQADIPIMEDSTSLIKLNLSDKKTLPKIYQQKLLAQAIAESFMSRFETERFYRSEKILNKTFELYPNYESYASLTFMHNLSFLKDVAFYKELGSFTKFDSQLENIGKSLLKEDPNNPYANYYLGSFYGRNENASEATKYFQKILDSKNFSRNWYHDEAENWLKELNTDN